MGRQGIRGIDPDVMEKRDEISAQYIVDFLNELLRIDKFAITDLVSERISVNKELANHPTVQVQELVKGVQEIGLLGIINGMFGMEGDLCAIEAVMDEKTEVIREFRLTEPWRGWIDPKAA